MSLFPLASSLFCGTQSKWRLSTGDGKTPVLIIDHMYDPGQKSNYTYHMCGGMDGWIGMVHVIRIYILLCICI